MRALRVRGGALVGYGKGKGGRKGGKGGRGK